MTADPSRGYVPHIDGLRAIAVLAVIVFHLDPAWLPGGFTGVDVFFVISGFVVSASVHRLPPLSLGQSMLRFYVRRIRRIAQHHVDLRARPQLGRQAKTQDCPPRARVGIVRPASCCHATRGARGRNCRPG